MFPTRSSSSLLFRLPATFFISLRIQLRNCFLTLSPACSSWSLCLAKRFLTVCVWLVQHLCLLACSNQHREHSVVMCVNRRPCSPPDYCSHHDTDTSKSKTFAHFLTILLTWQRYRREQMEDLCSPPDYSSHLTQIEKWGNQSPLLTSWLFFSPHFCTDESKPKTSAHLLTILLTSPTYRHKEIEDLCSPPDYAEN